MKFGVSRFDRYGCKRVHLGNAKRSTDTEPHSAPVRNSGGHDSGLVVVRFVCPVLRELFDCFVVSVNVTADTTQKRYRYLEDGREEVLGRITNLTSHLTCKYNIAWEIRLTGRDEN